MTTPEAPAQHADTIDEALRALRQRTFDRVRAEDALIADMTVRAIDGAKISPGGIIALANAIADCVQHEMPHADVLVLEAVSCR